MNRYIRRAAILGAYGTLLLTVALPAVAALGGTAATVQVDQAQLGATLQTTPNARYTTHELKAASGTTVREYVSPAGTVFGVAWQGPTQPDLRQLLGTHFDEYAAAVATRKTRRTPVLIELPTLVVQSSGHMRDFHGRAYVPSLLPANVSEEAVQ